MHFFNPVAVLPLVELARTPQTDDASLATAWAVTTKLRKTGVLVRDAPAFVVNRLLGRQGAVLTEALDRGNTVEETDEAVLRLGLPMAPSVLLQLVGPKVANHVRHTLHDAWPDRFPLSATLESLAEGGEPVVVENAPRTVEEIHESVLDALADEARHILEEGVVARPPTSTRASSWAPGSRSGSAGSRSTWIRPGYRSVSSVAHCDARRNDRASLTVSRRKL